VGIECNFCGLWRFYRGNLTHRTAGEMVFCERRLYTRWTMIISHNSTVASLSFTYTFTHSRHRGCFFLQLRLALWGWWAGARRAAGRTRRILMARAGGNSQSPHRPAVFAAAAMPACTYLFLPHSRRVPNLVQHCALS
jgi:hypothetical protein